MKKVDELNDVEALLRVYRKGILTDRKRLIVQSVARLAELDSSQDWSDVLMQAEEDLQDELERAYHAAQDTQDAAKIQEVEDEFARMNWSRPPKEDIAHTLVAVCKARKEEAERKAREEAEHVRRVAAEAAKEHARLMEEAAQKKAAEEEAARQAREKEAARQARDVRRQRVFVGFLVLLILLVTLRVAYTSVDWSKLKTPTKKNPPTMPAQQKTPVQNAATNTHTNTPAALPSPKMLFDRMKASHDVKEVLTLREELRGKFSAHAFVKEIKALPFTTDEAADVVKNGLKDWHRAPLPDAWTSSAAFQAFVTNTLLPLASSPFATRMKALYQVNALERTLLGLSHGEPTIEMMNGKHSVEGELYELGPKCATRARFWVDAAQLVKVESVWSCEELKDVIHFATREGVEAAAFEDELLKRMNAYTKSAADTKDELASAYRRVQLIMLYFNWLKDALKIWPEDIRLEEFVAEAKELAQPIPIEGLPNELTWAASEDARIQARNTACEQFLRRLDKAKFTEVYRAVRAHKLAEAQRANWKVKFVGRLNCPSGAAWRKNPAKFYLSIFDEHAKGHYPLYVLRKVNGQLVFKRVLEWNKAANSMKVTTGMGKQLYACDPLFQILDGTQTVNLETFDK